MKTRNGFVSNSSSSSFVVIATKESFVEALKNIEDKRYVKILNHICEKTKKFGRDLITINEYSDSGGYSNIFGDFDGDDILKKCKIKTNDDEEFCPQECLYELEESLDKLAKDKPEFENEFMFISDSNG